MQDISSTTMSYQQQEQQVKRAYDQYQQSLDPLRQKLSSLSDQLEIVIKIGPSKA
jgi:phage shock protein A